MNTRQFHILCLLLCAAITIWADPVESKLSTTTIKAEFEDGAGGTRVERNDASAGATILLRNQREKVELNLHVEQTGDYYLAVVYRHRGTPAKLSVAVDGQQATTIATAGGSKNPELATSESWQPLVNQCLAPLHLLAGNHTLSFTLIEADVRFGIELDSLMLSTEIPELPSLPIAIELESTGRGGSSYRSGASGFATRPCHHGDVIELGFMSAGSAGAECELVLRYANDGGADRLAVEVNGYAIGSKTTKDLRYGLPGSGWNRFEELHFGAFTLPSGRSVIHIRIEADEYGVELDKLEVRRARPIEKPSLPN